MSATQTITARTSAAASLSESQLTHDNDIQLSHFPHEQQFDDISLSGQRLGDAEAESPQPSTPWDVKEGWLVVLGGSAIFFVFLGLVYSYGIVQLHLEQRGLAKVSTLSFIGSVSAAISPLTCTVTARIIKRFGYRTTALAGSVLLGLGEFTAGFSTKSVPAMFVTQGFLFGIGAGLLFLPAATVPSLWFKKKRGLATGVVYGGAGIGSAVIALSLDRLVTAVGLETALKILGALAWAVCIPASCLLKAPVGRGRTVAGMQWRLFRSVKFNIMLLMGAVATFPLFVPPFLLPLYVSSVGLSTEVGAAVLASWNLASAVGRIGMGFGADAVVGPVNSMFLSLLLVGVSALALWPFASSLGLVIFFAIVNGVGSGGFFSLMPVVTGAIFGDERLAATMSALTTSWFFGYFMGAPIAGYLLDAYGGSGAGLAAFRPAIFYAGSLTLASAGLILVVRLVMNPKVFARV